MSVVVEAVRWLWALWSTRGAALPPVQASASAEIAIRGTGTAVTALRKLAASPSETEAAIAEFEALAHRYGAPRGGNELVWTMERVEIAALVLLAARHPAVVFVRLADDAEGRAVRALVQRMIRACAER